MPLKTIEEHNQEKLAKKQSLAIVGEPSGIECPNCKAELVSQAHAPKSIIDPPMKRVDCPKCEFSTFVLA